MEAASAGKYFVLNSSRSDIDWDRRGLVFDIHRFSTHDGPGIRTTVFTNGCTLHCLWCQNPEGLDAKQKLLYFREKCIGCGTCVQNCPEQAITLINGKIFINRMKCNLCYACVDVCPPLALNFSTKEMSVRNVVDEVLLDRIFFGENGGLTLSGGDPTMQADFNIEILRVCRALGIHTTIETSLHVTPETLERFLINVNLLIADFKVFNCMDHEAWTGVSNNLIIANFQSIFALQRSGIADFAFLVRIPLIPNYTAQPENIQAIGRFFRLYAPYTRIELLNYNPLAQNKYILLDKPYLVEKNQRMFTASEMNKFLGLLKDQGLDAFYE